MPDTSDKNMRRAIDSMAKQIRTQHQKSGHNMSQESARKEAVKIAKRYKSKYRD